MAKTNPDALTDEQIVELIGLHKAQSITDHKTWDIVDAWFRSELKTEVVGMAGQSDSFSQNHLYATVDTIAASVVPNKPTVTLKPRREDFRDPAKALEALANWALTKNEVEDMCWDLATDSVKKGQGITKISWDFEDEDPIIENLDNSRLWYDMSSRYWKNLRYVIEVTTISKAELRRRCKPSKDEDGKTVPAQYPASTKEKLKSASFPDFLKSKIDGEAKGLKSKLQGIYESVVIYEVYDLVGEQFHHFSDDIEEALFSGKLPYAHLPNPFYMTLFTPGRKSVRGVSDASMLASLQNQLNELDTIEFATALQSVSETFVQTALLQDPESFFAMMKGPRVPGGVIPIKSGNTVPISQIFYTPPAPVVGQAVHIMRARIQESIAHLLGLPSYTRGQGTDKLATNAMLSDGFLQTRQGRRQRGIFKTVAWMAESSLKLYAELLPQGSSKWLRHAGDRVPMIVNRQLTAMHMIVEAQGELGQLIDFTVSVYAGSEDNRATQLGNMSAHSATLISGMQAGHIPPDKFYTTLLELIGLDQLVPPDPVGTVPTGDPEADRQPGAQGGGLEPPRREETGAAPGPQGPTGAMPANIGAGGPGVGLPQGGV